MNFDLQNKNAVITGASGGFGSALARTLSKEGVNMLLHDIDIPAKRDAAEKLAEELRKDGVSVYTRFADLSKEEETLNFFRCAKDIFEIDILVNNAAIWPTAYVENMTTASFRKTIDINLLAPFILCREMVGYWRAAGRKGKIVNMVSQAAFNGSTTGHAHYAASKAGLVAFTVSLAREVSKYGINVNAVAPGMMRTEMNEKELAKSEDEYLKRIPIGRIADPQEVANVAAFLCSDKSAYMTGATVDVTGGMLMR